jgi:hypothetical protein
MGDFMNKEALIKADLFGFAEMSFGICGSSSGQAVEARTKEVVDSTGAGSCMLRVGIPQVGGRLVQAARQAGYPVLFSANAFMVRNEYGEVIRVRTPDPEQFAGMDVALDSAGYVAMSKYRGFPWTADQYLDLVEAWDWTWWASMDQCVEPEVAGCPLSIYMRMAETCRMYGEIRSRARDRGLKDPMPVLQGWEVEHYRWCMERMPLFEWPDLIGVGSMCRRQVHGPNGLLAVVEALDRELPKHVRFHLFGVKGSSLAYLSEHPRLKSVDSMAWDLAARRMRPTGRTVDYRIGVMHDWARSNLDRLAMPSIPYELKLFDDPASQASQELQEWLELVVSNEIDGRSALAHCMYLWIGK